jgi:hypothetical protein
MVVPMQVQPSQEFPDGQAGWWVKGQARDELARAMAEAGAPAGAPEAGAGIRVTLVSVRPVPNMSPAYQYRVDYVRPNGAASGAAAGRAAGQQAPTAPQQPARPDRTGAYGPYATPQYAAANPGHGQPVVSYPQQLPPSRSSTGGSPRPRVQPVVPSHAPAVIQAAPQPMPQPARSRWPRGAATPQGFNEEQAALFAKLTGSRPRPERVTVRPGRHFPRRPGRAVTLPALEPNPRIEVSRGADALSTRGTTNRDVRGNARGLGRPGRAAVAGASSTGPTEQSWATAS